MWQCFLEGSLQESSVCIFQFSGRHAQLVSKSECSILKGSRILLFLLILVSPTWCRWQLSPYPLDWDFRKSFSVVHAATSWIVSLPLPIPLSSPIPSFLNFWMFLYYWFWHWICFKALQSVEWRWEYTFITLLIPVFWGWAACIQRVSVATWPPPSIGRNERSLSYQQLSS